ncbi:hypothetical protein SAMN02910377_00976 [Pseudobutyrivibrio ruminis]|uniref:Membrane-spanning protein n=2 Tax=Pseudobutyrivibrio ruminis TaxID=46206 RepID=A0A1H7HDE2_9FIRM|nr:hypothetical protein [Pseudobutyrivibrio ruminis]SEK47000.1 hypothetical protein SAMN02910377_00976 [Pseudobutyrivibrio ruminis]SOC03804.1 hypothetical protein SAMN02910411_1947 [Pseudobutyrivibrio ruminis DSM 9787]
MKIIDYKNSLVDSYKKNKRTFIFYLILRGLVILTLIRCILTKNYESAAICILSLLLFLMPAFLQQKMKIEFPAVFQAIIFGFIYAAEILGEVNHYYVIIPGWDTMLHTMNGFLCAAIGFSLIYLLNRGSKHFNLSPFYLTLVAFCFSMTVGVIWEFFEFTMDYFFYLDMQKDFVVQTIGSVTLDPNNSGMPFIISNITDTVINTADGQSYTVPGGYLDIGIIDTMKDLLVNLVGAVAFSIIGYTTLKFSKKSAIADNLMIKPVDGQEDNSKTF